MLRLPPSRFPWGWAEGRSIQLHHHAKEIVMRRTEEAVGRAATKRGRERLALQKVVNDTGIDPSGLAYVEDKRSGTAKVVSKDGEVQARFSW